MSDIEKRLKKLDSMGKSKIVDRDMEAIVDEIECIKKIKASNPDLVHMVVDSAIEDAITRAADMFNIHPAVTIEYLRRHVERKRFASDSSLRRVILKEALKHDIDEEAARHYINRTLYKYCGLMGDTTPDIENPMTTTEDDNP